MFDSDPITLLNQKDYEAVGNIEIRQADWLRIRKTGLVRFVFLCCSASVGGRVGALIVLTAISAEFGSTSRFLIALGLFSVASSALHAVMAWRRLKFRFDTADPHQQ